MLPGFSMLVHGKSAKFWPIKRFYSLPRVRLREAHKDLYSANLKQKKERKEGTRRKARNPEGRKGTGSKGQRKKNKKRFDPQSAKRFECFQAGKEASQ